MLAMLPCSYQLVLVLSAPAISHAIRTMVYRVASPAVQGGITCSATTAMTRILSLLQVLHIAVIMLPYLVCSSWSLEPESYFSGALIHLVDQDTV